MTEFDDELESVWNVIDQDDSLPLHICDQDVRPILQDESQHFLDIPFESPLDLEITLPSDPKPIPPIPKHEKVEECPWKTMISQYKKIPFIFDPRVDCGVHTTIFTRVEMKFNGLCRGWDASLSKLPKRSDCVPLSGLTPYQFFYKQLRDVSDRSFLQYPWIFDEGSSLWSRAGRTMHKSLWPEVVNQWRCRQMECYCDAMDRLNQEPALSPLLKDLHMRVLQNAVIFLKTFRDLATFAKEWSNLWSQYLIMLTILVSTPKLEGVSKHKIVLAKLLFEST